MGTDFSAGGSHLFVSEWVENDEGGTARSMFFVAPMDLQLIRSYHAISGNETSVSLIVQKNAAFVAVVTGITELADTAFTVEWEGDSTVAGDDIHLRTGDVLEFVLPTSSVGWHTVLEFRRAS